jgi:hypothetical protein
MTRAARIAYWLAPVAFCIALYWLGLRTWFQQDDFVWLSLRNQLTDIQSLLRALFAPRAQGVFRSFSDRGFFLIFSYLFGLRASPYRLFVLLNQILNVVLVMLVTRKLTKSELAGFLAPLLWLSNIALIIPMSWSSAYNEIQYPTFLLLSFYLFACYTKTGLRKLYWTQFVIFVLGFGSLEINVVYPAVAALYALLFARPYLRSTLPMFGPSVIFAAAQKLLGRQMGNFYYEMDFHPASLITTLIRHWSILLGVSAYGDPAGWPGWLIQLAMVLLTAPILIFAAWQTWKRRFLPLFCLGWFLIVLGPLLPLHNHVIQYYPAIPAIGLAILGAHALSLAWERGWTHATIAGALALLYFIPSISVVHSGMTYYNERAARVRSLFQNVASAKQSHPGKEILLKNVDDDLFWSALYYRPFSLVGWNDIFLTPDSRILIQEDPHFPPLDDYFLSQSATAEIIKNGSALVLAVEGATLRDETSSYAVSISAGFSNGSAFSFSRAVSTSYRDPSHSR